MVEIPPEMEFEREFEEELEFEQRRAVPRFEYAWEKVAATAPVPDDRFSFRCCGTLYRATNPQDIKAMFNRHNVVRHGG